MAEDSDPDSKTEDPTGKRLDEARRRGDVAKTPELPQWASLSAATGVVVLCGGWMSRDLVLALTPFIAHPDAFVLENHGAMQVARLATAAAMPIVLITLLTATLAGIAGNVIQTGFLFAPEKIRPDISKLSPAAALKRMFGLDGLVNFGKSILKITVVGVICWMTLKPHVRELENLTTEEPAQMLDFTFAVLRALLMSVLGAMGVSAIGDWLWQRHRFIQRLKMSREEVKDEHRQAEGDPHVRGKQKAIRLQRAKQRMINAVPKATVVVMNPTHYAVALRYDADTPAPLCVAKGLDSLALKIREVAERAGVPVIEDPPLARALYAAVDLDQTIPRQHYEAVAKVIGFVLSAARRRAKRPHQGL